jgi:LIVCS family branched-chain amino acid:cation transporter
MIISLTLKNLDITNPKEIAKWILKSWIIYMILIIIIYIDISFIYVMSFGHFKYAENGEIVLVQLTQYF